LTDDVETYTLVEKLFYSAIADFSAMFTADTENTYKRLMRALSTSIAFSPTAIKSWVLQTYNAMRRFARCQWSPLAVPLPFANTYKPCQIFGSTIRRQVSHSAPPTLCTLNIGLITYLFTCLLRLTDLLQTQQHASAVVVKVRLHFATGCCNNRSLWNAVSFCSIDALNIAGYL